MGLYSLLPAGHEQQQVHMIWIMGLQWLYWAPVPGKVNYASPARIRQIGHSIHAPDGPRHERLTLKGVYIQRDIFM